MDRSALAVVILGSSATLSLLALARYLRRSEQKRRVDWVATHPPLFDPAFITEVGVTEKQATAALRVRSIVAEWAGVPPLHIYPDTSLADLSALEWDGANEAELELSLEEAFDPKSRKSLRGTKTVRDLVNRSFRS